VKDTRVPQDTCNPAGIWEDHLPRLNTTHRPIVNEYREGKVKRTSVRGVKENLKPCAYKQWKRYALYWECVTAYLLHNEPVSYVAWQG
jgi:hypothetical protein